MVVVIMGVAGSGKTTVGTRLATALGWSFYDADDYHPEANVAKMARGQPLTDADRAPWLQRLHDLIVDCGARGENAVLACSALKASYRRQLTSSGAEVRFVFLRADPALIRARLHDRKDHFAGAALLASQFAALEPPAEAIVVDAAATPAELVAEIRRQLHA